jgi:multidrug efflux pump subunit AcrB
LKLSASGRESRRLGASYNVSSYLDGKPAVTLAIFQLPGSNAVKTAHEVRALMQVLSIFGGFKIYHRLTRLSSSAIGRSGHPTLFEAVALV